MVSGTRTREESLPGGPQAPRPSLDQLWAWLREVPDPEIPVVSVVDLGIVRAIAWSEDTDACIVTITPTYSGCPATAVLQAALRQELNRRGIPQVELRIQISPPWTTDWLSPRARENLRAFGIAPPAHPASSADLFPVLGGGAPQPAPQCPHCGSTHTSLLSEFGSTLCKALYRCHDCLEPFDYFKCH